MKNLKEKQLSIFSIKNNKLIKTTFLTYANIKNKYKSMLTSLDGELFYKFLPIYDDDYDDYNNYHIPLDVKDTLKKFNNPKIDISKIKDLCKYFYKKYGAIVCGYDVTTDGDFSLYILEDDLGEEIFLDAYELKKGIVLEEIKKFIGIENPEIKIGCDSSVYSLHKREEEDNIAGYIYEKLIYFTK